MLNKTAIIFGATGMDGSHLSEILLNKDYKVYGVARRSSNGNDERVRHIFDNSFDLILGDITDAHSVNDIIRQYKPDEIYNLAAQSDVRVSFDQPVYTFTVDALGQLNVLEAVRQFSPKTKVYFAGSSEQFGSSKGTLIGDNHYQQNEATPFHPRSPYGVAKLAGFHLTKLYREAYNVFGCNGILFNHTSERRGPQFVERKISKYVAKLYVAGKMNNISSANPSALLNLIPPLKLGNLESYRDFGYSPDYCRAMIMMLENDKPDDYVIASGETHSIKEVLITAFQVGLGYYNDSFVETDEKLFRAAEVDYLCGNASKAKSVLGWEPSVSFDEIVKKLVLNDIKLECLKNGVKDGF